VIDYQISYKTGDAVYSVLALGITTTSSSYTASSLKADTVYSFKVTARNNVGSGPDSDVVSITVTSPKKELPKPAETEVPKPGMPKPDNWEKPGLAGAVFATFGAVDTVLMTSMTPLLTYGVFSWMGPVTCITAIDYMLKWFGIKNVEITDVLREECKKGIEMATAQFMATGDPSKSPYDFSYGPKGTIGNPG